MEQAFSLKYLCCSRCSVCSFLRFCTVPPRTRYCSGCLSVFGHCLFRRSLGSGVHRKKKFRPHSCFRRVECTDWHCGAGSRDRPGLQCGNFFTVCLGRTFKSCSWPKTFGGNAAGTGAIFNTKCNAILSVVVIVIAGILVVQGELDVGSMIGINILAAARCSQSRGF